MSLSTRLQVSDKKEETPSSDSASSHAVIWAALLSHGKIVKILGPDEGPFAKKDIDPKTLRKINFAVPNALNFVSTTHAKKLQMLFAYGVKWVALTGVAGSGKTELAKAYASKNEGGETWYMDLEVCSLQGRLFQLAKSLDMPARLSDKETWQEYFSRIKPQLVSAFSFFSKFTDCTRSYRKL